MPGIKIPQQDFALKLPGGLMREGSVFAGHYGVLFFTSAVGVQPGAWAALYQEAV